MNREAYREPSRTVDKDEKKEDKYVHLNTQLYPIKNSSRQLQVWESYSIVRPWQQ
jgi:hypothetical protein